MPPFNCQVLSAVLRQLRFLGELTRLAEWHNCGTLEGLKSLDWRKNRRYAV